MRIYFKRLNDRARMPYRATPGAAAYDLCAAENRIVEDGKITMVGTGLAWAPSGPAHALVLPRSGMSAKHGIIVVNSPGLIDSDYRGEIKVLLSCVIPGTSVPIQVGDRIAQLMIVRTVGKFEFLDAHELPGSERGKGGFGSTGIAA